MTCDPFLRPIRQFAHCSSQYASPAALQARITEVRRREAKLHNERIYLEALANRLHNERIPIARVPDEVLQTIFLLDHRSLEGVREIPRRNACLMSVSYRWMVAASSYAPLWSTIFVGLLRFQRYSLESPPQERALNALRMSTRNFVARSKDAPLYLHINPDMDDVILQHLHDCLQRCQRLEVYAFTIANDDMRPIPFSDRLSNLEDLIITAHERRVSPIVPPLFPKLADSGCRLKRLVLSKCEYDMPSLRAQIPSSSISTSLISLTISDSMDPPVFSELLLCCTYVRCVSYTRATTALHFHSAPMTWPAPDICLPHLESFIISGEDDVLRCIARISAPNLVNLEVRRTYNSRAGATTELPLWLAPNRARFPNLRVMKLLHLVEWAPADLHRFFYMQPALEHFHIISLSTTNVAGLLALADPNICPDLNTLFIQVSSNTLAEATLMATFERLWVPRRREHERMRQAEGRQPFVVRINGRFTRYLGYRLGRLLEIPPSEVMGTITPYEIPVI